MDVYFNSEIGTCTEFKKTAGGKKEAISIVISPTKVVSEEESMSLKVQTGCNMWRGCYNTGCFFSLEARKTTKKTEKKSEVGS